MDEQLTAPDPAPPPRSGLRAAWRRFRYWLKVVVLRLGSPSAADYASMVDRLNDAQVELLRTQVELIVAKARYEAAERNVDILADVCARDRERVQAELATATAKREQSINTAGEVKRIRLSHGDDG